MSFEPALTIEPDLVPFRDRDRILMADLSDLLASHISCRDLPLTYVVRGGVVHLRGEVPSESARRLVRTVIGRPRGINAIWDTLVLPGESRLRIIDIGCGTHKQIPWSTGVDQFAHEGVDVVTDLEKGLPFQDCEIDHVYAVHVLEHVRDLIRLMNEIHRCLKPGGILHVMVPNWESVNAIGDPTHVRFFNTKTFSHFCRSNPGVSLFRPLIISGDRDNLLADLEPIKTGPPPTALELARYFD